MKCFDIANVNLQILHVTGMLYIVRISLNLELHIWMNDFNGAQSASATCTVHRSYNWTFT